MTARALRLACVGLFLFDCGPRPLQPTPYTRITRPPPAASNLAPYVATDARFGTEHPLFPQAIAPDGRWVAACQARADTDGNGEVRVYHGQHGELGGDTASLFLFDDAHREGEPVDRLVDSDTSGRWMVVATGGRLELRDTVSGTRADLGADTLPGDPGGLTERSAALDAAGRYVAWVQPAESPGSTEQVFVRTLSTGDERQVDVGGARVWRASFAGGWLAVAVVPSDTDGDGVITLPTLRTTLAGGTCRGTPLSYSTYGYDGDTFEWRFFRPADGAPERRPVVAESDLGLLVGEPNGALTWLPAEGSGVPLVPAACEGSVYALWPEGPAVVMACKSEAKYDLFRFTPAGVQDLGISVVELPYRRTTGRLAPARPGARRDAPQVLVDLATGQSWPRAYGGEEGLYGEMLVEVDASRVVTLRDLSSNEVRALISSPSTEPDTWPNGRSFGRYVALSHETVQVIDLEERRIIGTLPRMPEVIRADGAALVTEGGGPYSPRGPMRWYAPP